MTTISSRHFFMTAFFALLTIPTCWGAKAPISAKDQKKESTHIVTGKVVAVTSEIQDSRLEKGAGNRDEIISIQVKVETAPKGKGVKIGDEILVVAWKAHTRIGAAAIGWQGHDPIPKKGQTATFYLKQNGKSFEPLVPNGIDIQPRVQKNPGELDDAVEPAAAVKPKGRQKPKPESERRSR